jgi:hypothetical protein
MVLCNDEPDFLTETIRHPGCLEVHLTNVSKLKLDDTTTLAHGFEETSVQVSFQSDDRWRYSHLERH